MEKIRYHHCILGIALLMALTACSSNDPLEYNHAAKAAKEMGIATDNYSVLLQDMDYNEAKDQYLHKYSVVYRPKDNKDTLIQQVSKWYAVNEVYFDDHKNDMGMSILRMEDGKPNTSAAPPGFAGFVGNEQYGEWRKVENTTASADSIGNTTGKDSTATNTSHTSHRRHSFLGPGLLWFFLPRFGYMGGMFGTRHRSPSYGSWNNYNTNYKPRNSSYYGQVGQNGKYNYGTQSEFNQRANPSAKWSNKDSGFRSRVRTRVARSASVSRSSGRYGSSGSLRSRGGGFGK